MKPPGILQKKEKCTIKDIRYRTSKGTYNLGYSRRASSEYCFFFNMCSIVLQGLNVKRKVVQVIKSVYFVILIFATIQISSSVFLKKFYYQTPAITHLTWVKKKEHTAKNPSKNCCFGAVPYENIFFVYSEKR